MSSIHYSELIEPSSIQHCAAAYFSCAIAYSKQPQIVCVRGSFLDVYSVVQVRAATLLALPYRSERTGRAAHAVITYRDL